MFDGLPVLRSPVLVAAFTGWNDAADSASHVIAHLSEQWQATHVATIDPDPYYDFQMARPTVKVTAEGVQRVDWPFSGFSVASPADADRDVVLLTGSEPSMHWRGFCEEIAEICHSLEIEQVILLGALMADVGYAKPLPVSGTSNDPALARRLKMDPVDYEGPGGIIALLHATFQHIEIPVTSCWVHVPHYAATAPCPKATLGLLHRLEELLDLPVPAGALVEKTAQWENEVTQLVESDTDIAEYINSLDDAGEGDAEPSGDDIARDFERYLRRRGPQGDGDTGRD
ncbi:PAC2 family protein [Stackebrandtia albiflava]|uniref:PAC2 family protein n=1 Tax=Stackebrandtia albiflava TaxID=406432 RepID=A0A562UL35_9ACTN|nr:PAC2 family protein [Stackebrandtia albiflava]